MISNGNLEDQREYFEYVEAGAGAAYSGEATYAWGHGQQGLDVWTVQALGGYGVGGSVAKGTSYT